MKQSANIMNLGRLAGLMIFVLLFGLASQSLNSAFAINTSHEKPNLLQSEQYYKTNLSVLKDKSVEAKVKAALEKLRIAINQIKGNSNSKLKVGASTVTNVTAQLQSSEPLQSLTPLIGSNYIDPKSGVEITFPDGWNGIVTESANTILVKVTKNATEFIPSITFEIMDKSTIQKMVGHLENLANNKAFMQAMMSSSKGCNVTTPTSITVNGMNGMKMIAQCTIFGQSLTYDTIIFETNKNFVYLLFMTQSTEFEKYSGNFNSTLSTLKISNTVKVPFADLTTVTPSTNTTIQIPNWVKK